MAKDRTYKKLNKDQLVAIAENDALQEEVRLHLIDLDARSAAAMPDSEAAASAANSQKAEAEKKRDARTSKANALRGRPLSTAQKADRAQRVKDAAVEQLDQLLATWEESRFRHEMNIDAGEDVEANQAALAIYDARLDAAEAKRAELRA